LFGDRRDVVAVESIAGGFAAPANDASTWEKEENSGKIAHQNFKVTQFDKIVFVNATKETWKGVGYSTLPGYTA
jgi:hypothetical protein